MDFVSCLVIGFMVAACCLLIYGTRAVETRWNRTHPPEDWDGTREEKFDKEVI